jgi:hypothetical protein
MKTTTIIFGILIILLSLGLAYDEFITLEGFLYEVQLPLIIAMFFNGCILIGLGFVLPKVGEGMIE